MSKVQQPLQSESAQNQLENLARLEEIEGTIIESTHILRQQFKSVDPSVLDSINLRKSPPNGQLVYPKFDKKTCYYQEFWKMFLFNEILISQVKEFSILNKSLSQKIQQTEVLQCEWGQIMLTRNKKKLRRTADMIEKNYICPFERCGKNYGTDVALNNHMKIKHNCGTKTDRENLAKEICLAESRGEKNNVDVYLTFPPGYLEHYRDYIFKKDKSKVM